MLMTFIISSYYIINDHYMYFFHQIIAQVGTVHTVLDSGDIRVRYPNNRTWTLNPASVTKVTQHSVGDVIRILDDISMVHNLQDGHGGWVDDMALVSERYINMEDGLMTWL